MKFSPTPIPDLIIIEPTVHGDERGFFMETWQEEVFARNNIHAHFVQDNHSKSAQGILRGLHYQLHRPQGKLVRVIRGEVYDVAVDMRKSSPTFGQWQAVVLSEQNRRMFWVPEGFAHGFYVLSEQAEFAYKCTDFYLPEHERTLRWNDPQLNIPWPLVGGEAPMLSTKDAKGAVFNSAELYP